MESHRIQAQRAQPSHRVRSSLLPCAHCGAKPRTASPIPGDPCDTSFPAWGAWPGLWTLATILSMRKEDSAGAGDGRSPDVIKSIILFGW